MVINEPYENPHEIHYRIPRPLQIEVSIEPFPYRDQLYWIDPDGRVIYNNDNLPVAQLEDGMIRWFGENNTLDLDDQFPYLVPDISQIIIDNDTITHTNTNTKPVVEQSPYSSSTKPKIKFSGPKLKVKTPAISMKTPLPASTSNPTKSIRSLGSIGRKIKVI